MTRGASAARAASADRTHIDRAAKIKRAAFALLALGGALFWASATRAEVADYLPLARPAPSDAILSKPIREPGDPGGAGQVLPAPDYAARKKFNVVVLGDSLGDGLWAGLYRVLKGDKRFEVIKRSKVASGFVRSEYYDWNANVERVLEEERVDIAVVMIGTNDRQVIVNGKGERYPLRAKGWEQEYRERIRRFTASLQARGAYIYWVGIPVMRSARFGGDMQYFNSIYREETARAGVPFVPTWEGLANAKGEYTAYGPDLRGREKLLRADDGIHFTLAGYQVLASIVADAIKTDIDKGYVRLDAPAGKVRQSAAVSEPQEETVAEPQAPAQGNEEEASADGAHGAESEVQSAQAAPIEVPELRPGRADDWSWPLR
jgi:hypothetical protein